MQNNLFKNITHNDFINLNKEELNKFFQFFENQKIYTDSIIKERDELIKKNKVLEEKIIEVEGQLILLRRRQFRKKSEKIVPTEEDKKLTEAPNKKRKKRDTVKLLPSERYPEAEIIEEELTFKELPICSCCNATMMDSGMKEVTEYLNVKPKEYFIVRQVKHKYRCSKCYSNIIIPQSPKRIIPGSAYGDDLIIDVALSKYCDLVPIERYSSIVGRAGLVDLPPNSLIGLVHKLAEISEPAELGVKEECLDSFKLNADETPQRMFEQVEKKTWYLWSFSTPESCYFEIRDTRSGDVASEFLNKSKCEYLISDVYSGYAKAVRETNKIRQLLNLKPVINVYCNAHARRKFVEAAESFPKESLFYINRYKEIYELEKEGKDSPSFILIKNRNEMKRIFELMRGHAETEKESYSSKSSLVTALNYFLKNFDGLTIFTDNADLPIDNNAAERVLRNPVIGRKTWYGTHSKQGARTAQIMFTLVESCKLNKINPREYFKDLVSSILDGKKSFTPRQYKLGLTDTS